VAFEGARRLLAALAFELLARQVCPSRLVKAGLADRDALERAPEKRRARIFKSKPAAGSRWLDARPVRITALDARGPGLRGATAIGAVAVGATALGAAAIGRLAIGRAAIKRLEIDELEVRRLRIVDLEVVRERPRGSPAACDRPDAGSDAPGAT
jgi:hypothetical protein